MRQALMTAAVAFALCSPASAAVTKFGPDDVCQRDATPEDFAGGRRLSRRMRLSKGFAAIGPLKS